MLIYVRDSVYPKATVRLEELGQFRGIRADITQTEHGGSSADVHWLILPAAPWP
jgi:hypothetical protein